MNNLFLSGRNKNTAHALRESFLYINKMRCELRSLHISRKRKLYRARFLRKVQQKNCYYNYVESKTKKKMLAAKTSGELLKLDGYKDRPVN